ncbi:MAG: multi-sensor signal transduction histidine kinase [Frankiales bacterium]|nr:multi-sensor signal transduction histidine kinase [Frankiales bacterium]
MTERSRTTGGAQGGRLLLAAGVFTLVNNYLPGSGHLDLAVLNTVGLVAAALGLICLRVPWERLPQRAPLAMTPVAFGLISLSNLYGGVSAFSYAVYFVVVFVWVGIAQPPGTSWWLLPPAAGAYLLPFLVSDAPPPYAISSVTVALPVCVLVGEVLSRTVSRLEQSQRALHHRVERVERLAQIAAALGADLDVGLVQQRLCDGAVELFEADGAVIVHRGLDGPLVLAGSGRAPAPGDALPTTALTVPTGSPVPVAASTLGLGTGSAVLAGLRPEPEPVVLCLLVGDRPLGREDVDLLRLLATQGAAALANAATHSVVVAQRQHEQAVVDVLADGVLVLDSRGLVLSCNDEAAALLGGDRTAMVGTAAPVVLGADGVAVHSQVGARWIETVATRLEEAEERVVTMRDISRQRALDEAKDLFLATTSHELRTPLTAIKGYVHVLQRRWEVLDDPTRLSALATIAERTEALVSLTNHLLLGARAGASRHSAARVPFDLKVAVAAAAAAYTSVSERHEVRCDVVPEPVQALGDPTNVAHIVGQLVENAVKYSPLGGTVEVRVKRDAQYAVVEVADEGIGLPPGEGLSLFAPFFQAGDTNTREFGGVGLGLYIVRQLVEAQGGTVFARNRGDVGAVIGFTVPLAVEPPAPRNGDESPAQERKRSR